MSMGNSGVVHVDADEMKTQLPVSTSRGPDIVASPFHSNMTFLGKNEQSDARGWYWAFFFKQRNERVRTDPTECLTLYTKRKFIRSCLGNSSGIPPNN